MTIKNKKQKKQFDPFKNLVLDEYEKDIEASIGRGEWKSVDNFDEVKKMFQGKHQDRFLLFESVKKDCVPVLLGLVNLIF